MRYLWHVVRALSALALALGVFVFFRGVLNDDPWASEMLLKIAAALGVLVPAYILWTLVVISTRKIKASGR